MCKIEQGCRFRRFSGAQRLATREEGRALSASPMLNLQRMLSSTRPGEKIFWKLGGGFERAIIRRA